MWTLKDITNFGKGVKNISIMPFFIVALLFVKFQISWYISQYTLRGDLSDSRKGRLSYNFNGEEELRPFPTLKRQSKQPSTLTLYLI